MAFKIAPIEYEAPGLDKTRCFRGKLRKALYDRAEGKCEVYIDENGEPLPPGHESKGRRCNRPLGEKWVGGHYPIPHHEGGPTTLDNGRAECNLCKARTAIQEKGRASKSRRVKLFHETGKNHEKTKCRKLQGRGFMSKERARAIREKIKREGYKR